MALTSLAAKRQRYVFDIMIERWDSRRYQFLKESGFDSRGGLMHNRDLMIAKQSMVKEDTRTGLHIFDEAAKWNIFEDELDVPALAFYELMDYDLWYAHRDDNGAATHMGQNFYTSSVRAADSLLIPTIVRDSVFPSFATISTEDVYKQLGFIGGTNHNIKGRVN